MLSSSSSHIGDLRGTRSSVAWSTRPGNWDALNLRAIFNGDSELGIPKLPAQETLPSTLINYNARNRLGQPQPGDCVHFFLDDYRFETMWTQPERSLARVIRVGMSLTPDFSLYPEMPRIVQMWNIYRSRWCGAWMSAAGVQVIPTVGWSDESSFEYAFTGLDPGGTVAISTVGIIRASSVEQGRFVSGYEAMVAAVTPKQVIIYGKRFPSLESREQVDHVYYDTRRWS
jgi:hypothetical protein